MKPKEKRARNRPLGAPPSGRQDVHGEQEEVAVVEEREPLGRQRRDEAVPGLRGLDAEHAHVDGVELRVERAVPDGGQDVLELEKGREDREPDARTVENGRNERLRLEERGAGERQHEEPDREVERDAPDGRRSPRAVTEDHLHEEHAEVREDQPVLQRELHEERGHRGHGRLRPVAARTCCGVEVVAAWRPDAQQEQQEERDASAARLAGQCVQGVPGVPGVR